MLLLRTPFDCLAVLSGRSFSNLLDFLNLCTISWFLFAISIHSQCTVDITFFFPLLLLKFSHLTDQKYITLNPQVLWALSTPEAHVYRLFLIFPTLIITYIKEKNILTCSFFFNKLRVSSDLSHLHTSRLLQPHWTNELFLFISKINFIAAWLLHI